MYVYLSETNKVNVKTRLEFELAYQNVAAQHVSHYTPGASLNE